MPVEAFKATLSNPESGIKIYGDPIHMEPDELADLFKSRSLDDFLSHEARHGIGNYILAHTEGETITVITSPGYCGGYYSINENGAKIGTTLRSVLPSRPQFDIFGLCMHLTSHAKSAWSTMPMTTLFSGVYRIPPCAIFTFTKAGVDSRSYLLDGQRLGRPVNYEAALNEIAASFASYYERRGIAPTLMFSGGVDSLAIYLALAEHMTPSKIRVVTFQTASGRSKANGHERALPVARNSKMEIEILPDNSLSSQNVLDALISMMSQDSVGTRSPHLAFCDHSISGHILHGQNMDAVVKTTMEVMQFNANRGYLTDAILPYVEGHEDRQRLTFLENLQSTEVYLADRAFQKSSVKTFARMRHGLSDPDPGGAGILRGLLTSQFANVLLRPVHPASLCRMLDGADREVSHFVPFVGPELLKPRTIADAARYHTYVALAAKRLTTFSLPSGASVQLVAMGGPLVTYSVGRKKGMLEASQPKREIFAYAQKRAGMEYKKLAEATAADRKHLASLKPTASKADDNVIFQLKNLLRPDSSPVLDAIPDARIRSHIAKLYSATAKAPMTKAGHARQFLALELLLQQ